MRARTADIPGLMATALHHQQAGRPQQAEALYRSVLKALPDLPDALHFLGLALHQMGKTAEGLRFLRKAVARHPGNAVFHNNLGLVLKSAGQLDQAETHCREAIRLQPTFAEAWFSLGVVQEERGKLQDAAASYVQATALRPAHYKALVNLAGVLVELGSYNDAVKACDSALRLQPAVTEASLILGRALIEMGESDQAERRIREALQYNPGNSRLSIALANALTELGRLDEANAVYDQLREETPEDAEVCFGMGTVAQALGNHPAALAHYGKAIELQPAHAQAVLGLSAARRYTTEDSTLIDGFERLLQRGHLSPRDTVALHFALGKMHDDCRAYDRAFEHYAAANALKREQVRFDREMHARYVDSLIEAYSPELVRAKADTVSVDDELPVFIIGMPRSGTTLVEQVIASHPSVKAGGEMPHLRRVVRSLAAQAGTDGSYPACVESLDATFAHQLAWSYIEKLPARTSGEIRVTDKMPSNFFHAGLIAILFSKARIIHCRRDPMDVCLSIFFQPFSRAHPYAFDLGDLGHYYRHYERLMSHWRSVLGERLFEVQYADLVGDPESISRRLIDHCGLEWNDQCLQFDRSRGAVRTASQWQVRQPIYKTSLQRWKHYERHLSPLVEALQG
jgi:tetratricopeptide (TPR) repeat protein